MTKMLVCGGRDYDDVPWMWMHLDRIALERSVKCVIDGGQKHIYKNRGTVGEGFAAMDKAFSTMDAAFKKVFDRKLWR